MAEWNEINSSALVHSLRFDSEYWMAVYLDNLEAVRRFRGPTGNVSYLGKLVRKVTGSAFYPSFVGYYGHKGLPFLRVADLGDLFLKSETLVRIISSTIRAHRQVATIRAGDLVIAKGGSIGGVCIVTDDFGESAVCRDVVAVQTDPCLLDPYYLAVFLNTRFGRLQLERNKSQQVQAHLTFPAVEKLEVAYPGPEAQDRVGAMAISAYQSAVDGRARYAEARQLLEGALGLDKLALIKPTSYTAPFSELESSRRMDPEHFFPAFKAFRAGLPAGIELLPLGPCLHFCQRGKQPIYAKGGLSVINSKHVQPNRVVREDNRVALPNPCENLQIRAGDTLLNGTGRGTIGRAAPYLDDQLAIADNHVTILRSIKLDPVYLALYLNSSAGQMQVEMHQRGTSGQLELYPFDIRKFLVWFAPAEFQQEIRRLYDLAAAAERQSRRLIEQAKTFVEHLIEETIK
jgi:type I restriction enzyme, S subunit